MRDKVIAQGIKLAGSDVPYTITISQKMIFIFALTDMYLIATLFHSSWGESVQAMLRGEENMSEESIRAVQTIKAHVAQCAKYREKHRVLQENARDRAM